MLAPKDRSIYVESLSPPVGFDLTDAVATAFSADMETLLSVPIHLALEESCVSTDVESSAIEILAAFRRLATRLTIFVQRGRVAPPTKPHKLYTLIEPVLVDVTGANGPLHAKLWLLRFQRDDEVRLRLVVPTRNLTTSRMWDAAVVLDGVVERSRDTANRPLADLLLALPKLAQTPSPAAERRVASLAEEVRRARWDGPPGWDLIGFHVLGFARSRELVIEPSEELLVVSPFVVDEAIVALAGTTKSPRALLSRPDELDKLKAATRALFKETFVLAEAASSDPDGEDDLDHRLRGLHAKLYFARTGATTNLWIGSANATRAGLRGTNVEILVQLATKKSRPIDEFLYERGMSDLMEPYEPSPGEAESPEQLALDAIRDSLAGGRFELEAENAEGGWRLRLVTQGEIDLGHGTKLRIWPITMAESMAVDGEPLGKGASIALAVGDVSDLTGLIAFSLTANGADTLRFTLNLPVKNMPEQRDQELLAALIASPDHFLSLMLRLFGRDVVPGAEEGEAGTRRSGAQLGGSSPDGSGLLEQLIRACAVDRTRLDDAIALTETVSRSSRGRELVPPFLSELLVMLKEMAA
ncbi:hypothetical protein BH09MYX1_BH09MYX1_11410 [soil metagenome]